MKNIAVVLITVVGLYFAPSQAHAAGEGGFMLGISAMRLASETSGPSLGDNDESNTVLDLKAGYTLSSGMYVGGIYDSRSYIINGSKTERNGYGVTLGYHSNGWFIDGSYYVSSTHKLSSGTELTGGSGFGVDVGHNAALTANTYVGLQIAYKSFSYTKLGANDETNKIKSELMPMLNLGITF